MIVSHFLDDFDEELGPEIWQEAAWIVIDTYFEEKGLVRQQIDSFNEFIEVCKIEKQFCHVKHTKYVNDDKLSMILF